MRIAVIGTEGTGKTAFVSSLGLYISESDDLVMEPSDYRTSRYVIAAQEKLMNGVWPAAASIGELNVLNWKFGKSGSELDILQIIDASGHDIRSVLLDDNSNRVPGVRKNISDLIDASDILIYMLDLENFMPSAGLSAITENIWAFRNFLANENWRSKRRMVIISKADRYSQLLENMSPAELVRKLVPKNPQIIQLMDSAAGIRYIPVSCIRRETLSQPDGKTNVLPGMQAVVDFITYEKRLEEVIESMADGCLDESGIATLNRYSDASYAEAQTLLGDCYRHGTVVEKNESRAAELYRLAAEQGHAPAQNSFGGCCEAGLGVEPDSSKAFEYYSRAAGQGYAAARYNLAGCYRNGIGVGKDEKKAVEYYELAAAQGIDAARQALSVGGSAGAADTAAFSSDDKNAKVSSGMIPGGSYPTGSNSSPSKEEVKALQYYTGKSPKTDLSGKDSGEKVSRPPAGGNAAGNVPGVTERSNASKQDVRGNRIVSQAIEYAGSPKGIGTFVGGVCGALVGGWVCAGLLSVLLLLLSMSFGVLFAGIALMCFGTVTKTGMMKKTDREIVCWIGLVLGLSFFAFAGTCNGGEISGLLIGLAIGWWTGWWVVWWFEKAAGEAASTLAATGKQGNSGGGRNIGRS